MPKPSSFRVQSKIQILNNNAKVANIIDAELRIWNHNLINQIFSSEESTTICSLPINRFGVVDKLSWWPARNRFFSVKSAYALEMNGNRREQGEPSSDLKALEKFWSGLWKLKIPRAAKYFLWNTCQDILLTRVNLAKRKVTVLVKCPLKKWGIQIPGFMDLWFEIMGKTPLKTQELCALIFCNI